MLDIEAAEVAVRRAVWEAKASLRQGFRKKVDQAAKTAICVYIHNLAHEVQVKNVYVPVGDDEEMIVGRTPLVASCTFPAHRYMSSC